MELNELRIGNLLHCSAIGDTYTDRTPNYGFCVFHVCQINANGTIKVDIGFGATQGVDLATKDAEPIQLTEKWLEKFGFINETGNEWNNYDNKEEKSIVLENFNGKLHYSAGEGIRLSREVNYVHELQNLNFALTGEELKIK